MFSFSIERIRLDLGNEVFTEAIISQEVQNTFSHHASLEELISEIKTFLTERHGEYVEFDGDLFIFDTKETTIYGMFFFNDEEIDEDEIEALETKLRE